MYYFYLFLDFEVNRIQPLSLSCCILRLRIGDCHCPSCCILRLRNGDLLDSKVKKRKLPLSKLLDSKPLLIIIIRLQMECKPFANLLVAEFKAMYRLSPLHFDYGIRIHPLATSYLFL